MIDRNALKKTRQILNRLSFVADRVWTATVGEEDPLWFGDRAGIIMKASYGPDGSQTWQISSFFDEQLVVKVPKKVRKTFSLRMTKDDLAVVHSSEFGLGKKGYHFHCLQYRFQAGLDEGLGITTIAMSREALTDRAHQFQSI